MDTNSHITAPCTNDAIGLYNAVPEAGTTEELYAIMTAPSSLRSRIIARIPATVDNTLGLARLMLLP